MCKQQSLRDIKREETVHALAQAAFELALELGMDGFVIEDIVQRARYSRRTFANYFSCKEEAVAMAALTFSGVNEAEILHLPESTPPLDALQQWMRMQLTADLLWKLRELVSLSKQYPTLEPYLLSVLHRLQTAAQEALSGLYNDRYPSEYTHLLTGAVFGAILPIVNGSLIVLLPGDSIAEKPGVQHSINIGTRRSVTCETASSFPAVHIPEEEHYLYVNIFVQTGEKSLRQTMVLHRRLGHHSWNRHHDARDPRYECEFRDED